MKHNINEKVNEVLDIPLKKLPTRKCDVELSLGSHLILFIKMRDRVPRKYLNVKEPNRKNKLTCIQYKLTCIQYKLTCIQYKLTCIQYKLTCIQYKALRN